MTVRADLLVSRPSGVIAIRRSHALDHDGDGLSPIDREVAGRPHRQRGVQVLALDLDRPDQLG
jgi:hypothetical protein